MGQLFGRRPKEKRKAEIVPRPQGPQQSHSEGALPSPYDRGCGHAVARGQGIHETGRAKWFLARQT